MNYYCSRSCYIKKKAKQKTKTERVQTSFFSFLKSDHKAKSPSLTEAYSSFLFPRTSINTTKCGEATTKLAIVDFLAKS